MHAALLTIAFTFMVGDTDVYFTNHKYHKIPVLVPPNAKLFALQLHTSTDFGTTWRVSDAISPEKDSFVFRADKDGPYWFRVSTVDMEGRLDPADFDDGPPDQKMVLDTTKPDIQLAGQRSRDKVVVRWEIEEPFPDLSSFKLEWLPKDSARIFWNSVLVDARLRGQTELPIDHAGPIVLRLKFRDRAGNVSVREFAIGAKPSADE